MTEPYIFIDRQITPTVVFPRRHNGARSTVFGLNSYADGDNTTVSGGNYNNITFHTDLIGSGAADTFTVTGLPDNNSFDSAMNNSTIGGGSGNQIQNYAISSVISGGSNNVVGEVPTYTMTGDPEISLEATTDYVDTSYATISGGSSNLANGLNTTVGGGSGCRAIGAYATVGGGFENSSLNSYATVSGGSENVSTGMYSAIPGGRNNTATGVGSFVCGAPLDSATNSDNGYWNSFIWADSLGLNLNTHTVPDGLVKRSDSVWFACGGSRDDSDPVFTIYTNSTRTHYARLVKGVNGWVTASDATLKENFVALAPLDVVQRLETLPIYQYNFIGSTPSQLCFGPTAQDWHRTFPTPGNEDGRTLNSATLDAMALAGVKGVAQLARALEARASALEARASLAEARASLAEAQASAAEAALAALAARVAALEAA